MLNDWGVGRILGDVAKTKPWGVLWPSGSGAEFELKAVFFNLQPSFGSRTSVLCPCLLAPALQAPCCSPRCPAAVSLSRHTPSSVLNPRPWQWAAHLRHHVLIGLDGHLLAGNLVKLAREEPSAARGQDEM